MSLELLNFTGPPEVIDPMVKATTSRIPDGRSVFLKEELLRPEHFELEQHRVLFEFWNRQPRIEGLPASAGIDPLEFWKALGTVMLLEPNADISDFFYRVHGSQVAGALGVNLNQKWLSALTGPLRAAYLDHYRDVCRLRRPAFSEHPAAREHSVTVLFCRLTLPMAGPDGQVDRLLASTVPLTQKD